MGSKAMTIEQFIEITRVMWSAVVGVLNVTVFELSTGTANAIRVTPMMMAMGLVLSKLSLAVFRAFAGPPILEQGQLSRHERDRTEERQAAKKGHKDNIKANRRGKK